MSKCHICNKITNNCCSKCKSIYYCSNECQKIDWNTHKKSCKQLLNNPHKDYLPNMDLDKPEKCKYCNKMVINEYDYSILPCNHIFHYSCIIKSNNIDNINKLTCIICNKKCNNPFSIIKSRNIVFDILNKHEDFSFDENDYFEAANIGEPTSQNLIGSIYIKKNNSEYIEKALKWFYKSVYKSIIMAEYNIGMIYYFGTDTIKINLDIAEYWLKSCANKNHVMAQRYLAELYYEKKDYNNSFKYYKLSADNGNTESSNNLAIMYKDDDNYKDYNKSIKYFKFAADNGNQKAMYNLAQLYENNLNYELAFKYYNICCDNNIYDAYAHIGNFYECGFFVKKDLNKAFEYYKKGADFNISSSLYNLGRFYDVECKSINIISKDNKKSFEYYKLAADLNLPEAFYSLGIIYEYGNDYINIDYKLSYEYYKKATEFDMSKAYYKLGYIYENGNDYINKDYKQSFEYYNLAANLKCCDSLFKLGCFYEFGNDFITKDLNKALEYYKIAIEHNSTEALCSIANFYEFGNNIINKDLNIAYEYYKKAYNLDSKYSYYLALYYYNYISNDDYRIIDLLLEAINNDIYAAAYVLGMIYSKFNNYNLGDKYLKLAKDNNYIPFQNDYDEIILLTKNYDNDNEIILLNNSDINDTEIILLKPSKY